ncbi:paralemmin-3 [Orycteropus afer afer]|uniref:Paralemmin-3 n=1 Tax=Orycteropus afer afer TaxID=1230840 RepID=A0A8B7B1M2_ORYAF|nr:paralemmin-3 [Orycteropus afer afer]
MALQSQVWSSTTPMPMAESSLYRQRLEVIAEKRRLQEKIRAARLELEEEKLRVERLKRKSLRERWLMDGAAEGPDWPKDPASQDPQSPESQAQARIQNLEDSLFTLQAQLQLLQSASTGAQHKPLGRPTWRRQGHRPLSQPTLEAGPADPPDLHKRASLPVGPAGMSPESPSEPREEAVGVLPQDSRRVPGVTRASSEANGPCSRPSPPPEQEPSKGTAVAERGVDEAKGGDVVQVVWEGLRVTEDCAMGTTGPELEAKVEEVVMEAIGDRQPAGSPELPSWVKEDRDVVEVVWEGVGGTGGSDFEGTAEGGRGPEAAQLSSPRPLKQLQEAASREGEVAPGGSPEGSGPGGSGGEEGSFIWVERVTLSEEWEELLVEGVEGLEGLGPMTREGGDKGLLEAEQGGGGKDTWEVGRGRTEESVGVEKREGEEKPGTEREGGEEPPGVEKKGGEEQLGERREAEGSLKTEQEGSEEEQGAEQGVEEALGEEKKGDEVQPGPEEGTDEESVVKERKGGEEPLGAERAGGEEPLEAEREPLEAERAGGEEPLGAERAGGEELVDIEKTQGVEEDLSPKEQRESLGEKESEAGASLGAKEEPRPEDEGLQPQEKPEVSLEEAAAKPQTPTEDQGPLGDATPLLAETAVSEQPTECQPLLLVEGPSANPSARPVPTYAPAQQPEPSAPTEGEEASGPKQKTCQCCAVM